MVFFCDDGFYLKGLERCCCIVDGIWGGMEIICEGNIFLEGVGVLVSWIEFVGWNKNICFIFCSIRLFFF